MEREPREMAVIAGPSIHGEASPGDPATKEIVAWTDSTVRRRCTPKKEGASCEVEPSFQF